MDNDNEDEQRWEDDGGAPLWTIEVEDGIRCAECEVRIDHCPFRLTQENVA